MSIGAHNEIDIEGMNQDHSKLDLNCANQMHLKIWTDEGRIKCLVIIICNRLTFLAGLKETGSRTASVRGGRVESGSPVFRQPFNEAELS